ncbi:MAG: hypothetical protein BM558_05715 [Roseobacter sp. MedPE-SW]|nr:MAG: hypothetical protein BM558_05715 [Roseobacter sp. MedPE-SW]
MTRLVADLGGTNCRLALSTALGRPLIAGQSYPNAAFDNFSDLLGQYLDDIGQPRFAEMVIAVAGPVKDTTAGQSAEITNRGWRLDSQDLSQSMGEIPVHLFNDLSALGHGLADLETEDLAIIHPEDSTAPLAQKLVIGIGTGFNVSPVSATPLGVSCLKSEYGHVALPLDLHQALDAQIGEKAHAFKTVECCFSGRGFAALYAAFAPEAKAQSPADIMADSDRAQTMNFLHFYADLLGQLSCNLLKGFLPSGGLYFAGSVARNLLEGSAKSTFLQRYTQPDPLILDLTPPVYCILDDAAALKGCAKFEFPAKPENTQC